MPYTPSSIFPFNSNFDFNSRANKNITVIHKPNSVNSGGHKYKNDLNTV